MGYHTSEEEGHISQTSGARLPKQGNASIEYEHTKFFDVFLLSLCPGKIQVL